MAFTKVKQVKKNIYDILLKSEAFILIELFNINPKRS